MAVFGKMYIIMSCVVESSNYGKPAKRKRRLTWLLHKGFYVQPITSWPDAAAWFHRQCNLSYNAFLVATEGEIAATLAWLKARHEKRRVTGKNNPCSGSTSWDTYLAGYERRALSAARETLGPKGVVSLTQTIDRYVYNRGADMYTLTTRSYLNWVLELDRIMTPEEVLGFQGVPAAKILNQDPGK